MSRRSVVLLALAAGAVVGGAVLVLAFRRGGEPLTAESLAAARAQWGARGPEDYDLEVSVSGRQRNLYRVEVRGGEVSAMTVNGEPAPERVHEHWTVEGMFGTLERELENRKQPQASYGVEDASRVELRVEFDEERGWPRRFLRHVYGGDRDIEWEVSFTVR